MRWVIAAAVGYWMAYQIYQSHDKRQREAKEREVEMRLRKYLSDLGWSKSEVETAVREIIA